MYRGDIPASDEQWGIGLFPSKYFGLYAVIIRGSDFLVIIEEGTKVLWQGAERLSLIRGLFPHPARSSSVEGR